MKKNVLFSVLLSLIITITLAVPAFADDPTGVVGESKTDLAAPYTVSNARPPAGALIAKDNGFGDSRSYYADDPSPENYPDGPYLWTGTQDHGDIIAYSFFKFVVPPHPGVVHDCLRFGAFHNYTGSYSSPGKTGAYYFRNNSWSQATLTWNSTWIRSFHSNRGKLLDSISIPMNGLYKYYEWNVTGVDPDIWEKGGTLTIVLAQTNPGVGEYWKDFENVHYDGHSEYEGTHPPYLRLCGSHKVTESSISTPKGSWLPGTTSVGTPTEAVRQVPVSMPSISIKSASLSSTKVAPGEAVTITADVVNTGTASGSSSIQVYINGAADSAQGVTVNSGSSAPVTFTVKRSEPGTYTVHVGGVSAGTFTVDAFANNDFLIYGLIALFTAGIGVVIYMITRRRTA